MKDISSVSSLSKDIFDLSTITKETQSLKIDLVKKKFKKLSTIISGFNSLDEAKDVEKFLKKRLACGGTVKKNVIELQGNQKERVKKLLIEKGYKEELIDA